MMRLLLIFVFISTFGSAQNLNDSLAKSKLYENILSFHANILLEQSGQIIISEDIQVYAAGEKIRRGIFRSLPLYRDLNGKKNRINYEIISVLRDGLPETYHTENSGPDHVIYFGKKDYVLPEGVYTYQLKYRTKDQIGFFEKYDEFYWNVNGTLWDFEVDDISATITLPENANIIQMACYTGAYGSTDANCKKEKTTKNTVNFSAQNLKQNEGLSIAVGFDKGLFVPPPPPGILEKYGVLAVLLFAAGGLLFYFYSAWQNFGRDPEKPIAYPQFNAPKDLSPASVGYLRDEYYSETMITAAIINLGIKGFIRITEDDQRILGIFGGKKYTLEKIKDGDTTLPVEEFNLLNNFFPGSERAISFEGKYNSKIENAVTDFKASLKFQHDPFLSKGNNRQKVIIPLLIVILLYSGGIFFSYKSTYNDIYLAAAIPLGAVLLFLGIIFSAFFERFLLVKIFFAFVTAGLILLLATVILSEKESSLNIDFYSSFAFIIFGFISLVLFQYLIKQPTREKLETQSLIEGFKMYLGAAEEKTLQFHNPPEMTPTVFEKMLPFAMVLGVDKIWGEKFQNIMKKSALGQQQYHSSWFIGSSIMNMNFASTLNSSLSQSIASSATQPSSSGSGSGGGGFSGGGGGGGGGGGW